MKDGNEQITVEKNKSQLNIIYANVDKLIDQISYLINLRFFEMKGQSKDEIVQPLISADEKATPPPVQEKPIPPASFLSLFAYTTQSQKIQLIVGTIAAMVSGGTFPFFLLFLADITTIFDQANRSNAVASGWELCWKFFIVGALIWASHFVANYCWNSVGSAQSVRLKKLYYKTLLEQQVQWFDQNDPNKIVTKVSTGIAAIEVATGQKISLLITTVITSVAAMFLAFFKCWQLSLMLLATLPALFAGGMFFMKALILHAQRQKVSYEAAASRTEQALGQIKTVKSLSGQDYQMKMFQTALNDGKAKVLKYNLYQALGQGLIIFIFISIYSFGFWYGKKLIIENIDNGKYNVATILSTFFCFLVGGSSVGQISPFFKNIADGRVSMAQLLNLINRQKTLVQPEDGTKIKSVKKIKLQNISFHYKSDQPALKNINISFRQGKVSALVGQSGCGKSTIIQLLLRYYDAKEGRISINGKDIKQLNMNNYRRKIGFVGQEPVLFAMSIAENLRLADPTLSEDQIIQALKKANAWEFVEKMDKKLDTYVGSGGAQLSGGQKQRIAIARALCKNPQILILDEATSALDRKNQKQIQQTLKNLVTNGITTIVIAHRLSTVRDAECIYVLKKGQLSESGRHQDLLRKGGLYSELVQAQMQAEKHIVQDQLQINRYSEISAQAKVEEAVEQKKQEEVQIPKEKQDAVFRKLINFQKANLHLLFIGILGTLASGMVWPFFNYVFSGILSLMMRPVQNNDELNLYCLYIEIVAIVSGSMTLMYSFCFGLSRERLVYNLRMKLFDKLLRMPASYYDKKQNTAGAISIKLSNDAFQLNNMVSGVLGVMCLNIATISTSLVFGLYYSWKVTLIAIALSPLIAVVGSINMKVVMKFTSMSQETQKFLGSLMSDSVCNIRTVKSFGRPKSFLQKFDEKLDELNKVNSAKHFRSAILSGMSKGMIMFVEGIIFLIAAALFQDNQVDSGRAVFTAVFSVIFAAMGVGQNSQFMPDMAKAKLAGAGIFDILQSKDEKQLSLQQGGTLTDKIQGSIEFRNVSFRYPQREKLVLQNLSFKIQGQKIVLVGHSGSGKSTVVQLLMRFYDPEQGQILINNRNIKEYDLYSLRKQIGLVSQQPALFIGSVKDNIRYNSQCSQEEIQKAAQISHAKKFITDWEEGFDKEVGQKGNQVSGGQKQRIALSRCLVKDPSLYLFDQFTSALDTETQRIIFENMKDILKGKTSISVAHRLTTAEDSDRIFVFKDGKIIEEGNYKELMELRSHFFSLAQGK